jgi:hypothetical protein
VLKADVRHYFDTVDHEILMRIIGRKIKDHGVIQLIETIMENHKTETPEKGMPIGNLTSQFFANVYLHELDLFVKHQLKAKYYIRYVDDFVILHPDRCLLENWKGEINGFLKSNLKLDLHPEKSKVEELGHGVTFLGFRVFRNHRLLKKSNSRRIWKRLEKFKEAYIANEITSSDGLMRLEGWLAYARFADTYGLRTRAVSRFNQIVLKQDDADWR